MRSDAVTAVSEYLKERTVREFKTTQEIEVIPNFVNCEVFKKSSDSKFRARFAAEDEGLVIHISNFRPVKRTGDVIEFFSRLRRKQKAKLLMVGDGPERPKAEWLAEVHGIQDDVAFLGKSSDMEQLLSISDILVLPSEQESFGLVALEAMASEVPVIATRVGGVSEVVEDGADGFLFDVGDTDSMAEAGASLIGDRELRLRMGKSGRDHAHRDFCHEQIVKRYAELYEKTISKSS